MLAPHFPFDAAESPLSFAARLAKLHSGDRLVSFLRDVGIKPEQMAVNDEAALSRLAEDDQVGLRRGRWEWALSVVRTCPHHEIPLLRQAQVAWDDKFHEFDRRVPERGEKLDTLISKASRRPVSPLQDYVMRRLEGKAGPKWLDAQTLDQATRATELLGVLIAFGPAQRLPDLSSDEWDHAGRVGFAFTVRGEVGIREALAAQFSKFDDASGTPGARKIFGCFYNALAHSKSLKEPGDIARILREVIIENIALPEGEKILGAPLGERHLHTVASLAKEQGLDTRTLRSVLVAAKVIPEKAPAHFSIPVGRGREVARRVKRMVHVISLPDVMNCTRPLVDQLFADRLLTPIYSGTPGVKGRTQKSVDRDEVAMLVGKLHAKAIPTEVPCAGVVPVSKAAEKAKVPAITVVHLILGGFLENVVRIAGQEGIGALRVDPAEVKRHAGVVTRGLSSMEAFEALKIPRDVGWRLVDHHHAVAELTVTEIMCRDTSHRICRFNFENISAFKATFTTPARLAEQHDLQVGEVVGRLKRAGSRPVISKAEVGVDCYRISDLPGTLFA